MDASTLTRDVITLERSLDSLEFLITISTVLVVIGLIVEYWFPLSELIELIKRPPLPWKKLLETTGGVLVTIGVAGELWFQSRASHVQTFIRSDSHQIEGLLQKEAADANLKTEELRTRILQNFGPRDLSQEKLGRITSKLAKFAGVKVDVYGIGVGNPYNKTESEESIRLARQLVGALIAARIDAAGWIVQSCSGIGGSNVIVSIADGPRDTRLASEIIEALEPEIDTFPEITMQLIPDGCVKPLSGKPKEREPNAALSIVIGRKIPSLLTPGILGIEETSK